MWLIPQWRHFVAYIIAKHTFFPSSIMVRRNIMFVQRTTAVHNVCSLAVALYYAVIMLSTTFFGCRSITGQATCGTLFLKSNTWPHVARRTLNSMNEIDMSVPGWKPCQISFPWKSCGTSFNLSCTEYNIVPHCCNLAFLYTIFYKRIPPSYSVFQKTFLNNPKL